MPLYNPAATQEVSQQELDDHAADTTSVHGITDTSKLVTGWTAGRWYGAAMSHNAAGGGFAPKPD